MDIKRRCTIKDRKKAAEILACMDHAERITQKQLDAVGLMSDAEVLKFLDDNTPQALEVEEIKPGALPDDLFTYCNNLIIEFCDKFNLDPFKLSQLQWGAACSYVGRGFSARSAFRVPSNNFIQGANKKIDSSEAARVVPVWRDLCAIYNQVPFCDDFCMFAGLSYQWLMKIEDGAQGVTPADIDLYKEVHKISKKGLNKRLSDPNGQKVGAIFYAKAIEGYQETTTINHTYENPKNGYNLPVFGSDPLEIEENSAK